MRQVILTALLAAVPLFANPEMTVDLLGGATMDFVWIAAGIPCALLKFTP